ncbi:MAG: serine hydrolase [Chloroflexota bacterium]
MRRRRRSVFSAVTFVAVLSLLGSVILFTFQLARFSRMWAYYPSRMTIGGVPMGGLNRQQAAQRLLEVFSQPIELRYEEARIQLKPETVGFELDLDAVLAAAEQERTRVPFWTAFWDYLWGRTRSSADIPLRYAYSQERLEAYLNDEIAPRYDTPPVAALPQPGTVNFSPGRPGINLDTARAIPPIENALASSSARIVTLPFRTTGAPSPSFQNLEVLLRQTVELSGFDGTIGLFFEDLQTGEETSFVYDLQEPVPMPPDVAFTASSTIKIPIMISVFRRLEGALSNEVATKLEEMITKSINPSSDWLMQTQLNPNRGPLLVTEDMRTLGLNSTFLGGYFFDGAPLLLPGYQTPANSREDIDTNPDLYNQTTPTEMGMLLTDLYQCGAQGGGALIAAFGNEITQAECRQMIDQLAEDRIGALIQAGLPDGTRVAHKHGWVSDNFYIIHNVSDAAIVYTPNGNFVLTVYLYHPVQIIFESANDLIANLAEAAFNYYNSTRQ